MDRLKSMFETYHKNVEEQKQMHASLFAERTREELREYCMSIAFRQGILKQNNDSLLQELKDRLDKPLDDDIAELLFQESMKLYEAEIEDYLWIQLIHEKLIPYYENKGNKEKLLWLYGCNFFNINAVKNVQFGLEDKDYSSLYKAIHYAKEYTFFADKDTRYRIWIAYNNLVISILRDKTTDCKVGFDLADEMFSLWNDPVVLELDGESEKIKALIENTKNKLMNAIHKILHSDEETQERFIRFEQEIYENEMIYLKREGNLSPLLYGAHLFAGFMQKKYSIDEIFDLYMEYYRNKSEIFKDEETPSKEALDFYIETTEILSEWADMGVERSKIHKLVASMTILAQKKWDYIAREMVPYMNFLLEKIFVLLARYGHENMDVEGYLFQLVINRNLFLYLHTITVVSVSKLITEAAWKLKPEIFWDKNEESLDSYLYQIENCAMIHDVGKVTLYDVFYAYNRTHTKEEEERKSEHPKVGMELIEKIERLRPYKDVVMLHHVDFDGTGYTGKVHCFNPEKRILVDIVHLADSMVDLMFHYDMFEEKDLFGKLCSDIIAGKGTKYHPGLVEVLEKDQVFCLKLKEILLETNFEGIYKYMQNLLSVTIKQGFEDLLVEVEDQFINSRGQTDLEKLRIRLEELLERAVEDNSQKEMGIAYYHMMKYFYLKKDPMSSINNGLEAVRYLENTQEYGYLSQAYNLLGEYMQLQGNHENAIGYFLKCVEYAKYYENGKRISGLALNNIANLFKESGNYERALYYYHQALELTPKAYMGGIYGKMIFCYAQLGDKSNLIKYFDKMQEICDDPQKATFDIHVYSCIALDFLKDEDLLEKSLDLALHDLTDTKDYLEYLQEFYIFSELLTKLGRYAQLAKLLDECIECSDQNALYNVILSNLVQRRIECGHIMQDMDSVDRYGEYMRKNEHKNKLNRAKIALQMEKACRENIQIQRKQRDILKVKQKLEQEVLEASRENTAKSGFINSMSHEIRTPIHAILGLDEMIMRECKDENILQYANDIHSAGRTLIGIINDILDFSKMESGEMDIHPENYRVKDVIFELRNMIESRAKDKNLGFHIQCDQELPRTLYGDDLRIKQVILNVLSNAVKYTNEGSVVFSLGYERMDEAKIMLKIVVKDTGIGMRKEDLEKLSTPFVRFDERKNHKIEGTGLGMSIVRKLVDHMEGKLTVSSEYGKGSTFAISIPQVVMDWTGVGDIGLVEKKSAVLSKREALFMAPEAEVLLVDDNAVNLKVVSSLLKRTKVKVTTAKSGEECLELAEKNPYHIILLDHRMPKLDGVETLKILKQMHCINSDTPVVALTANAVSGAADFYHENGFDALVTKPVDHVELEKTMMALLPKEMMR